MAPTTNPAPAEPKPAAGVPSELVQRLSAAAAVLDPSRLPAFGRRLPPADSLAFYAALVVVGVVEIVEWPAVLIAAGAQVLLDRRLGTLETQTNQSDRRAAG